MTDAGDNELLNFETLDHQVLTQVMERINKLTGNTEDPGYDSGLMMFPEPESKNEHAVNAIFDGLGMTIRDIAEYGLERVMERDRRSKEYAKALRVIEPMAQICRVLADDKLKLTRDLNMQDRFRAKEDTVYVYFAQNFKEGEIEFDEIEVFIRPEKYTMPLKIRDQIRRRVDPFSRTKNC